MTLVFYPSIALAGDIKLIQFRTRLGQLFIILAVATSPLKAEDWFRLSDKGPKPIVLEDAHRLFDQCSRYAPQPVGPLWLPTAQEIEVMEEKLVDYLASYDKYLTSDPRWSRGRYRGQHVGFGQGSDRFIYGSYDNLKGDGNGQALVMCDGGAAFWGVLYNIDTGAFSYFAINGR